MLRIITQDNFNQTQEKFIQEMSCWKVLLSNRLNTCKTTIFFTRFKFWPTPILNNLHTVTSVFVYAKIKENGTIVGNLRIL